MLFLSIARISLGICAILLLSSCGVDRPTSLWRNEGLRPNHGFSFARGRERNLSADQSDRFGASGVLPGSPEARDLEARATMFAARERRREAKILAREAADRAAYDRTTLDRSFQDSGLNRSAGDRFNETTRFEKKKRWSWFSRKRTSQAELQTSSNESSVYINQALLDTMQPSNAAIEIDLRDQRTRLFDQSGGMKTLVIDAPISSGKEGYATPAGRFTINEKLVDKRSSTYGVWLDAAGVPVPSSGDVNERPSGASQFVGAEMPYWLRINGPIGMHIGDVPNFPASHGCIRVPASVQPLIYSRVALGTPVTVIR